MNWNVNDWICAGLGWVAAIAVMIFVPESIGLLKLALVFLAGFCVTFIARAF
jgi:hypothetical protein